MMGIQDKEALIAEIEKFKEEAMKSYVVSRWAESYVNSDPFGYVFIEDNKIWWMKTQAHQLWCFWQAAKAVPEGFVVVPTEMSWRKADEIANDHWSKYGYSHVIQQQGQNATGASIELARLEWCRNKAHQIMRDYKAMIEGMEQKA